MKTIEPRVPVGPRRVWSTLHRLCTYPFPSLSLTPPTPHFPTVAAPPPVSILLSPPAHTPFSLHSHLPFFHTLYTIFPTPRLPLSFEYTCDGGGWRQGHDTGDGGRGSGGGGTVLFKVTIDVCSGL